MVLLLPLIIGVTMIVRVETYMMIVLVLKVIQMTMHVEGPIILQLQRVLNVLKVHLIVLYLVDCVSARLQIMYGMTVMYVVEPVLIPQHRGQTNPRVV
jgi:hypothetical protein